MFYGAVATSTGTYHTDTGAPGTCLVAASCLLLTATALPGNCVPSLAVRCATIANVLRPAELRVNAMNASGHASHLMVLPIMHRHWCGCIVPQICSAEAL